MTLAEIKMEVRILLGDVSADVWDDPKLDVQINEAYRHLVGELDRSNRAWNVLGPQTVTIPSGTQEVEFPLAATRKIVAIDGDRGDGVLSPFNLVEFDRRRSARTDCRFVEDQVYVYRTPAGYPRHWRIGLPQIPSGDVILAVWYVPVFDSFKLNGEDSIPLLLPDEWHPVIAKRAAVVCKVTENRDASNLAALYAADLDSVKSMSSSTAGSSTHHI